MYLNLIHKDNELKVMLKLEKMFANSIKIGFKNIEIIIWFGYPSDWFTIFSVTLHYSILSSSFDTLDNGELKGRNIFFHY